jgi:hypothetical protein
MTRKIILTHKLAPGDVVVTTSLVRDAKLTYGDDLLLAFNTNQPAIYENNPYLSSFDPKQPDVEHLTLDYSGGLRQVAHEKMHFSTYHHRFFSRATGLETLPLFSKPDIHLSERERVERPITGRYWLVFGGGKSDITVKHWDFSRYQSVVDRLQANGLKIVQSGSAAAGHIHPPLKNVLNIVGWGGLRELIWQIAHCEGVICPITCAMHLAAAFDKPCVCIAGGREEPWWEAYVDDFGAFGPKAAPVNMPHRYLHTVGLLDCCRSKGCWRRKVIPIDNDQQLCHKPVGLTLHEQPLPLCMSMITVDNVVDAVMSYYEQGLLPKIDDSNKEEPVLTATAPWSEQKTKVRVTNVPPVIEKTLGNKFTVFAYCSGDNTDAHARCLTSIQNTIPHSMLDLRIVLHDVDPDTTDFVLNDLELDYTLQTSSKFETMRRVLRAEPIESNYFAWFESPAFATHKNWLLQLATAVARQDKTAAIYGMPQQYKLEAVETDPRDWFYQAKWFNGRDFLNSQNIESPNGDIIRYCASWFWVMRTAMIEKCDIPDRRLRDVGGEIAIGEQLHQHGYRIRHFNVGKSMIYCANTAKTQTPVYPWEQ